MNSFKSFTVQPVLFKEMVALTPNQLAGANSQTDEERIDILIKLIKSKKPLELAKGGTFKVGDDYIDQAINNCNLFKKNNDHFGRGGFTLIDKGGNEIKSNALAKNKEFGGGIGGAGAGTADTERNESHNACMMKAMVDNPGHDLEYYDDEVIAQAYKSNGTSNVSGNTDQILETPENWWKSSYYITKYLISKKYIHKNMEFHRGSSDMIKIYALKNLAFKNSGFTPLKDDKWNPGDVWAIQKGFNLDKLNTMSIHGFNKSLISAFNKRELVGISLKLVKNESVPFSLNNIKQPPEVLMHKISSMGFESGRGNFWSSKSAFIKTSSLQIDLKDGSRGGSIKGDIKGKTSRGGGIGYGPMLEIIKAETGKMLPKHAGGITKSAKDIADGKEKDVKEMYKMFNEFYKNVKYEDFVSELEQKDWQWISSKYACMKVLYTIQKAGGKKSNVIVTRMINYAGSTTAEGGVYIKLGK
jgi:hypothetical protein